MCAGSAPGRPGIAIFSTGVASLVGVPVYILLARKFDTRWLMMFGLASFGLSMWSFSFITHDWGGDRASCCRRSCAGSRRSSPSRRR